MISPTCIMISPHSTEHPHGTQDNPHGTHDIPHGTEHPPRYSTYPPTFIMISPTVLNTPTVLHKHYTGCVWRKSITQSDSSAQYKVTIIFPFHNILEASGKLVFFVAELEAKLYLMYHAENMNLLIHPCYRIRHILLDLGWYSIHKKNLEDKQL